MKTNMNVFIVHGTFGNPFENWFPWLAGELNNIGISCTVPSFPTPGYQNYKDWESLMDYYYSHKIVNESTVLIGHSCGSVFLVHYLLSKQIRVKGIICVSGYNNFISGNEVMDMLNMSFYFRIHDDGLHELSDHIHSFFSDNDPNIPKSYLIDFSNMIGAKSHCIKGAGHFNEAAGYTKFDEILKVIKSID